jgi:hypothetical protein
MKRIWAYIVGHNVWNKVVGSLISGVIATVFVVLVVAILPSAKSIDYSEKIRQFFTVNVPMWLFLLIVFIEFIVLRVAYSRKPRESAPVAINAEVVATAFNPAPVLVPKSYPLPVEAQLKLVILPKSYFQQ